MPLQGCRLPDAVFGEPGPGWDAWARGKCAIGAYMKVTWPETGGVWWYVRDPHGHVGSIVPAHHTVEEHEDGSITVLPSLLDDKSYEELVEAGVCAIVPERGKPGYHGYLTRGVWSDG